MNVMKGSARRGIGVLLASGLIAGVVSGSTPADSTVPEELRGYRQRLIEVMNGLRVPGIAVAVVKDGKIIYLDAVGERDPDSHLPVTPGVCPWSPPSRMAWYLWSITPRSLFVTIVLRPFWETTAALLGALAILAAIAWRALSGTAARRKLETDAL